MEPAYSAVTGRKAETSLDSDWSFTVLAGGQADFLDRCKPIAQALSSELPNHQGIPAHHNDKESPLGLVRHTLPHASFTDVGAIFGVLLFVVGWAVKRVLDDVYEVKVRPHFRKWLGEINTTASKREIFFIAIWDERLQKGAVVAISGDSPDGRLASESTVTGLHFEAEHFLKVDQSGKPIVLFIVHNGLVQEPALFETLSEIYQHIPTSQLVGSGGKLLNRGHR